MDRLAAAPGVTIRESFESPGERDLDLARDRSGQYARGSVKEDNVKQMVIGGSKGSSSISRRYPCASVSNS